MDWEYSTLILKTNIIVVQINPKNVVNLQHTMYLILLSFFSD